MRNPAYEFVCGGEVVPQADWHTPPHWHSFHEIIVVMSGRMRVRIEGKDIDAAPGDVLHYPAGISHEEWSDPQVPVRTFFIAFRTSETLSWLLTKTSDAACRLRQVIAWLVEDRFASNDPSYSGMMVQVMLKELERLGRIQVSPWLDSLRTYMRRHLSEPIALGDLARQAGLSRFAFVRKFKSEAGRPPMTELRCMRLAEVRTLLLTTTLPIKSIAAMVGFRDEFQVSKLFRAHFKMAPKEMRRTARQ